MSESACQCHDAQHSHDPCACQQDQGPARSYAGLPVVFMAGEPGQPPMPAPFLMSRDEAIRFFRLYHSGTRFPAKAIARYRGMGLATVRVGRCVWYRLDDALRFLDAQQARLRDQTGESEKSW
jgi:hypothetical protein